MASCREMKIQRDERKAFDNDPDLDYGMGSPEFLFKFKDFDDQIDFDIDQHVTITK